MGKTGRTLLLGISVLFLLSTTFMACGSSEEENGNVVIIKTPVERLQDLELGLLDTQTNMDNTGGDYAIILNRVDQIEEELNILAAQIDGIDNSGNCTCPVTLEMYEEATHNITVLQGVIYSLDGRIDILEETYNVSGNSS